MKKRVFAILLAAVLLAVSFAGCSGDSGKYRIGIVQPMEHLSLNTIRESIVERLEELGLSDKVEIIYKNGQGDASNLNTIVQQLVTDKVDMLVPIGTGATQTCAAATAEIPIVFAAVSYPVNAGLVTDLAVTDKNITGVSDPVAIEDILSLAMTLTPDVKTFGFIYNSSEPNSVANMDMAKAYCDANGISYVEGNVTNTNEVQQVAQSVLGKADAIFVPNDNTVATAMPVLAAEGIAAKKPVYVGADSMVADGGLATVGIDYTVLGRQVADMIARIMDGKTIAENPIELINEYAKMVNSDTAEAIGVTVPDSVQAQFVEAAK